MASRGEELNTRLTATDDASKVVDKVAEKVEDLEDKPHEVELEADTTKAEQDLRALDRRFDDLTSEERVAVLTVQASQAERELKKITRELANADAEDVTIFVEARDQASKKLQAIRGELQEIQSEADKTGNSLKDRLTNALDGLEGRFGGIGGKLGGALAKGFAAVGAGALMVDALQKSWDEAGGLRRITGQFRLSAEESAEYGKVAGELYADNWGDALTEVQQVVALAGERLEDVTDQSLGRISAQILAVSQTWGVDYANVIRSITQLTQNGLVPSSQAALDLIVTGFQDGADEAGDFLDTIDEYSQHWEAMGLSGEDALNQIVAGLQLGQRDTDKLADAVKEMRIRVVEDTEAIDAAYQDLGLRADDLREKFLEGGPAAREAFLEVLEALKDVEDPIEQNRLAIELIGTQFEDLGPTALEALTTVQGALRETDNAAQDLSNTVEATPWEQLQRDAENYLLRLGNFIARGIQGTDDFGQGFETALAGGRDALQELETVQASVLERGQTRLARLGQAGRRAGEDIAEGFDEAGDAIVETAETATDRALSEFEQFVSDVNALWANAIAEANAPLDELRQRLENEKIFERLGEQLERVKAAPGDRQETRDLLNLVLDLGEAYDDIPRQKIVELYTQIERGQVEAAFNEIQQLANQRQIRLQIAVGGTSFRIDPNGGAPTQIETPTTVSAVPTQSVTNIYQIAPTQGQVVGATDANRFANGARNTFR